jgi:flagellar basal-body rod modification protein FlgD
MTTTSTIPATATTSSTPATAQKSDATVFGDNFNTFLTLLTTQLKNQDPTSPLDTNQFTSQLVQFSQVEQEINANTKLVSMTTTNQAVAALPLVGRAVEYDGSAATLDAGGKAGFSYTLPSQSSATVLSILDASGSMVWRGAGETATGRHDFAWDGKALDGSTVPPGTYTLSVAAAASDSSAITATTTAVGTVSGIELQSGQALMDIGGLKIPTTKMISIKNQN